MAATEAGVSDPFVQTIFTREGGTFKKNYTSFIKNSCSIPPPFFFSSAVPKVANITALARLSGTRAILTWQPYTLDTSKGFLTKVEVAYQIIPVTSTRCPSLDSAKVISVNINESRYTFTDLQAEDEYCVAVRAWTARGSSQYSEVQRLPCKLLCCL